MATTMKAWEYTTASGGLEKHLKLTTTATRPKPKSKDQVLVKILAASLNPADYKVPELPVGVGNLLIRTPAIPGMDFCGRVVLDPKSDAPSNPKFKHNQLVFGRVQVPTRGGTLAEYTVAPMEGLAPLPEGCEPALGAAVGTAGLTGYQTIVPHVKSGSGAKVFINGGSGGTGTFGIQVAKAIGCHVTVSCSGRNEQFCRELGADEVIDYTQGSLVEALKSKGQEFDLLVDNVCNDATLYKQCDKYLKPGAKYIQIGAPGTAKPFLGFMSSAMLPGFLGGGKRPLVLYLTHNSAEDLGQISTWMGEGKMKPVLDSTFDFEDAPKAFEKLKTGRARGKIVVTLSRD